MGGFRVTDPETCRLAYEQMEADGSLSTRRLEIAYSLSTIKAPKTAGELAKGLGKNRNNVATRLSEMSHLGVAEKVAERPCLVSGKQCWTWQLTGKQPKGSVPKGTSKSQIYKAERDDANKKVAEFIKLSKDLAQWAIKKEMPNIANRINKRTEDILRA